MNARDRAVGACCCGSVKFVITLPAKFCVHCHCRNCRAIHGAAMVTWVGVPIGQFKISGRRHLKWYQATEESRRGFCIHCGTPILYMSTKFPGDIHITRASLKGKVNITPYAHIFFDQHVDWCFFEDKLARLGGPEGTDPIES